MEFLFRLKSNRSGLSRMVGEEWLVFAANILMLVSDAAGKIGNRVKNAAGKTHAD